MKSIQLWLSEEEISFLMEKSEVTMQFSSNIEEVNLSSLLVDKFAAALTKARNKAKLDK